MTEPIRYESAPRPRPDLLEDRPGEHVWTALAVYRVQPEVLRAAAGGQLSSLNLDRENLATIEVGCYRCEEPYSTRLSYRKCPGEPR
jgi:hypothetical protein